MTSRTPMTASAQRWDDIWGARPDDWASVEEKQRPTYEEVTRRIDLRGQRAVKQALAPFMPPRPRGAPAAPALWRPGFLEGIAAQAGLSAEEAFDAHSALASRGRDDLLREMLAPANGTVAPRRTNEATVRHAILRALEPYRTRDGGYRLENEWHS